jgi:electron transfer flavoprotein alpha subunit
MAGVLVFGDSVGGKLAPASLEMASAGAALAQALNQPLLGALIGASNENALDGAAAEFGGGFATLYLLEGQHLRPYTARAAIAAARAAIEACQPSVVLFPHTLETREWVPRLAAMLDTGLVMDCTALTAEGSDLVVSKPVYGGGVMAQYVVRGSTRLATVRTGVFEARSGAAAGEIQKIAVVAPAAGRVTLIDETKAQAEGGVRLKDSKIIVSGGRGLGGPDNWHYIEKAAAAIGGAVGCSRPVADSGWVSSAHQVGLSGTSVKPDLYIAVGISGAVQHLAGISNSSTVVAINVDGDADMFTRANYGVVGDYKEVLPGFIERAKQLRE